ncbi:unnamed protein product [Vitrella brassicaformis CCMP3155]|uniref:Uncharacterized protein n=1 Tax=Vitrella brassicaformis (strain CCMP3155) TaxID=1169540 RepID=A0A0G4F298_VITBC|nr:unnamed protein product [Vitrella brassicaformis CCMP3155]|eukprot:CEM05487.1 unnamed protein product [Vitrella brassicaformis CCMP3155]
MRCGPLTIVKMLFYTLQIAKMLYGPLAVLWPSRRDMVVRLYQVGVLLSAFVRGKAPNPSVASGNRSICVHFLLS